MLTNKLNLEIKTNQEGFNIVDARELYNYLNSKQQFADWIKKRIIEYGFAENEDFTTFHKIMKRETGATKLKEYAITLDMAKELAMVERTEKGREARKYFIAAEKELRLKTAQKQIEKLPAKRKATCSELREIKNYLKRFDTDYLRKTFNDLLSYYLYNSIAENYKKHRDYMNLHLTANDFFAFLGRI